MRTQELFAFILERWLILQRRNAGESAPWTKDPILGQYRFCNVFREDDKVTKWIAENLRKPLDGEWNLIPVMAAARFINRISTLEALKDILLEEGWHPKACPAMLRDLKKAGQPIITGAYMVKTPVGKDKITGLDEILRPIQKAASDGPDHMLAGVFQKGERPSLQQLHERLLEFPWVGGFMSAQIIADVKYTSDWKDAPDWFTFAASGPGSRRGLNYVLGRDPEAAWKEQGWKMTLMCLYGEIIPLFEKAGMPRLHAQDLQNGLCEFSKYERTRLGTGKPKQRYNPSRTICT